MATTSKAPEAGAAKERAESVLTSGARSNFEISSPAFKLGEVMPPRYTGEGEDVSPPLAWSGAPEGTREFALICHDPDAPGGEWHHWVLYNIPASVISLPESLPRQAELGAPAGARQGLNSWPSQNVGYRGPMPPKGSGPHRYIFSLFALDDRIELPPGEATADRLERAMADHVLAECQTIGTYQRK
jgi:Raf kinase inhibitor-like YbhB/YbcL family protein